MSVRVDVGAGVEDVVRGKQLRRHGTQTYLLAQVKGDHGERVGDRTSTPVTDCQRLAAIVEQVQARYDEGGHITRAEIRAALDTRLVHLCPVPADDVDRTDDIATWIATLPAGSHATFCASEGRTYRLDRALNVTADGLTFTDAAFHVQAPSAELDSQGRSLRRHLWFRGCADLTIGNVTVAGQNTTADNGTPVDKTGQATYDAKREWEHALAVEDCHQVTVTNFTADAIFGDGAYWRRVTDGTLDGFTISRNGRQGAAMVSTTGLRLLNGRIVHSRRSGIDLEPNLTTEVIEDVEIGYMDIRSRLLPVTSGGPGVVRRVHVHDITVRSGSAPSLALVPHSGGRRDEWLVERWTTLATLGSPASAVAAMNADGLILRDVTVPCNPSRRMTAVIVTNPGRVEMERCDFPGAAHLTDMRTPATNHTLTVTDCTLEV